MMTYKPFEETATLNKITDSPSNEARPVNVESFERIASIMAGLVLTARGLARRSFFGLVIAAIGAALVRRGVIGYCPLYAELGQASLENENLRPSAKRPEKQMPT